MPLFATPRLLWLFFSSHLIPPGEVGAPYVCSYPAGDKEALLQCVTAAMATSLPPLVPPHFTPDAYAARVKALFGDGGA
jgi:hypothetical protein